MFKTWGLVAIFYAITGFTALFWYIKYQFKNNDYKELCKEIRKKEITPKERIILMKIVEIVKDYKFNITLKEKNAYTELNKIKELVYILEKDIKKEELETLQTTNSSN